MDAGRAMFVENILLAYFLGMCSFLACSKNVETAVGLGAAVIFVNSITAPVNWALNHFVLRKGAFAWAGLPDIDLSFLAFITFIDVPVGQPGCPDIRWDEFHWQQNRH